MDLKCLVVVIHLFIFSVPVLAAVSQVSPHVDDFKAKTGNGDLVERDDLGKHFKSAGVEGTFVLYDAQQGGYLAYDRTRADSGFVPASTFKILNALIALETRAVEDENETIKWDGVIRGFDAWNQDHNLRSAVRYSAVWFFQEIARRIGEARMWHYVQAAEYGNTNIDGGIDRFWLDGELRISAIEQIQFLRKLYDNNLPFSDSTIDVVKHILIVEEKEAYTLRAKTGWADLDTGGIGWWVGYVERGDDIYFFATNIDIHSDEDAAARVAVTRAILRDLGIIGT